MGKEQEEYVPESSRAHVRVPGKLHVEPVERVWMRDLWGTEVQEMLLDLGDQALHELLQGAQSQGMFASCFGRKERLVTSLIADNHIRVTRSLGSVILSILHWCV